MSRKTCKAKILRGSDYKFMTLPEACDYFGIHESRVVAYDLNDVLKVITLCYI